MLVIRVININILPSFVWSQIISMVWFSMFTIKSYAYDFHFNVFFGKGWKGLHFFKISNRRCRQKGKGRWQTGCCRVETLNFLLLTYVLGAKFHREFETLKVHALQIVYDNSFKVGLNIREWSLAIREWSLAFGVVAGVDDWKQTISFGYHNGRNSFHSCSYTWDLWEIQLLCWQVHGTLDP